MVMPLLCQGLFALGNKLAARGFCQCRPLLLADLLVLPLYTRRINARTAPSMSKSPTKRATRRKLSSSDVSSKWAVAMLHCCWCAEGLQKTEHRSRNVCKL